MNADDRRVFLRAMAALAPYLDQLVVVGGWAHQLHRLHDLAAPLPFEPLRTQDADLAAPERLVAKAESVKALLMEAGFTEHLKGDDRPPVAEYELEGVGSSLSHLLQGAGGEVGEGGGGSSRGRVAHCPGCRPRRLGDA